MVGRDGEGHACPLLTSAHEAQFLTGCRPVQVHRLGGLRDKCRFYTYGGCGLVTKSCLTLVTPQTAAYQDSLPMGFPRQEYQSGLLFPYPGDLSDPGVKPTSPAFRQILYRLSYQGSPGFICVCVYIHIYIYIYTHIFKCLFFNVYTHRQIFGRTF